MSRTFPYKIILLILMIVLIIVALTIGLGFDSSLPAIGAALVSIAVNLIFVLLDKDTRTLTVAYSLTCIALILLLVGIGILKLYSAPTSMPEHSFNIAIAEFRTLDAEGKTIPSELGKMISKELYTGLKTFPEGGELNIWHDSVPPSEKRFDIEIGPIEGHTTSTKALTLEKIALELNADILVYGSIAQIDAKVIITPEFYIARLPAAAHRESVELLGSQQLGPAISSSQTGLGEAFEQLAGRAKRLALVVKGLRHLFADAPLLAIDYLDKALGVDKNNIYKVGEIVFYYKGQAYLALGELYQKNQDQKHLVPEQYNQAEIAFNDSLNANRSYARAHIGLGILHFEKLRQFGPKEEPLESAEYNKAIDEFTSALAVTNTQGSVVEINAHRLLGSTYRIQGEIYANYADNVFTNRQYDKAYPYYVMAEEQYDNAIAEMNVALKLLEPNVYTVSADIENTYFLQIAARAYNGLGAAYHQQGFVNWRTGGEQPRAFYEQSIMAYDKCINIADEKPSDPFLRDFQANYCQIGKDEVAKALGDLNRKR